MAKTPIYDPGSSEARSSWLAGLAEACSKMSGVLDMAAGTFEDLPLPELFISNDDRYRIYQAPSGAKLWLSATIKKNGAAITEDIDGFSVNYLGGSVVFDEDKRLTADDVITASGTYVIGDSEKITSILSDIATLSQKAGRYKGYYDTIAALTAASPTASNGDYAIVGETESFHVWSNTEWVDTFKPTDLSAYYTSAKIDELLKLKQDDIPAHGEDAASDAYYYGGRKTWQNIYEKILSAALTGFAADDDSAVTAVDTVLTALGKLQAQINSNIHPLKGTGAPTTSTEGVIGQEYINTSNGDVYRCTAIQDGSYTWVQYQDKLQGTQGQIVGFDASGKAIAQAPPDTGVTSFNGRSGDVTPQEGDYTAEMVNARPDTWMPTAEDVGALSSDDIIDVAHGGTGNSSVDTSPVSGSTKMITSGGVYNALKNGSGLTGVIPVSKGGTGNSSVDTTPTSGSTKMVTSGGLFKALYGSPTTSPKFELGSVLGATSSQGQVAFGNGLFLVSAASTTWGYAPNYAYSQDGKQWTVVSFSEYKRGTNIVYYGNKFVMLGDNQTTLYLYTSTDGLTWTSTSLGTLSTITAVTPSELIYAKGMLIGSSTGRIIYSTDGINWTGKLLQNTPNNTATNKNWSKIVYGNGKFVVIPYNVNVDQDNYIAYSTNGIDWSFTNDNLGSTYKTSFMFTGLAYGNGRFVMSLNSSYYGSTTSQAHRIMCSEDGITWRSVFSSSENVGAVVYVAGRFLSSSGSVIISSTDGVYWYLSSDIPKNYNLSSANDSGGWSFGWTAEGNGVAVIVPYSGGLYQNSTLPIYSDSIQTT